MADGNRRVLQADFSAGAFPLASYDQIPVNGVFDAQNLLVDDDRSLKIRGGSRWAAPALGVGTDPVVVVGRDRVGPRTIVANTLGLAAVNDATATTTGIAASNPNFGPGVSLAGCCSSRVA
jgi:hypothetical protein